jgi:hypothetical protein
VTAARTVAALAVLVCAVTTACGGAATPAATPATAPPPPAETGAPAALTRVSAGPGPILLDIAHRAYAVRIRVTPNALGVRSRIHVSLRSAGRPVAASVDVAIGMLDMPMATTNLPLKPVGLGTFAGSFSGLSMAGRWGLVFVVRPLAGTGAFPIAVEDRLR